MSHACGIEICIVIIKAKANLSHSNLCQPRKNLYFLVKFLLRLMADMEEKLSNRMEVIILSLNPGKKGFFILGLLLAI